MQPGSTMIRRGIHLCHLLALVFVLIPETVSATGHPAVFGLANAPGSAAVPSPLADGVYTGAGTSFRVAGGRISLAAPASAEAEAVLSDGRADQAVSLRQDHLCVSDAAELAAAIALPAAQKAGLTVCLNPGHYDEIGWPALRGAFSGLPDAHPVTFRSTFDDDRAVLDRWVMQSRDGQPTGNVSLEALDFRVFSPDLPEGGIINDRNKDAISIGAGAVTRNFHLRDITVTGSMTEARTGGHPTELTLVGLRGWGENISVTGSHFSRVMNALILYGQDIRVEGNRGEHLWGDFLRLSGELPHPDGTPCRDSGNIMVRNNIVSDSWGNDNRHPDAVQIFPISNTSCGIRGLLIEGNIVFMGRDGTRHPAYTTGFRNSVPVPAPPVLAFDPGVLQRLTGPGTTTLPPADCTKPVTLAVQKLPGGGAVTLLPAPGERLQLYQQSLDRYRMTADWEIWRLQCRPGRKGWSLIQQPPLQQGFFSNNVNGPGGYHDVIVRYNITWLPTRNGVVFLDPNNTDISVYNNSFLQPWPGDTNADGLANTPSDGFNTYAAGTGIRLFGAAGISAFANVSSTLQGRKGPQGRNNDDGLRNNDGGRSMMVRFVPIANGYPFLPTTPFEAVMMARPRPGGPLDGPQIGALASRPEKDWYDWSWVPPD